jgi:hypothetical protein
MLRIVFTGIFCAGLIPFLTKGEDASLYFEQIKPVLQERCYACHGALKQKADLRLDTASLIQKGGESGKVILVSSPDESELIKRLTTREASDRMPPEGKPVDAHAIQAIRKWIAAGAPTPEHELPEQDPLDHWAFKLPAPAKPGIQHSADHPIDAMLSEALERMNLIPQHEAEPTLLMRRLFLDLTGLPPSPEQIEHYIQNPSDTEYEKIVDQLLASPQYGERWGRHWMDVWRYSDWFGLGAQLRYSAKHIWHWRDWIIESLNEDKGYNQMIREMLAADELYPTDNNRLRATGFLVRNYFLFNRTTWLDKTIEHTSKAFLGLTMQCGKCHDHKYDPITAQDYYRFRAILEPHQIRTDALPGKSDLEKNGLPRAFDMHPDELTYVHVRGDEKNPDKSNTMVPSPPAFLKDIPFNITPVLLPHEASSPALRPYVLNTLLEEANDRIRSLSTNPPSEVSEAGNQASPSSKPSLLELELRSARMQPAALVTAHRAMRAKVYQPDSPDLESLELQAGQAAFEHEKAKLEVELARARQALQDGKEEKKDALRKELEKVQDRLEKRIRSFQENPRSFTPIRASLKALESPAETGEDRGKPYPSRSTGRRTALANWIVHPNNPLTARVAINHIWMRHFGAPLVDPVTDFGRRTPAPKLQSILDDLAVRFMNNNWRMKPIHRLIVTSKAYRRSSSDLNAAPANLTSDSDNQYLWRQNPKRMESQVVRDSLLSLANRLDSQMGGPDIDPSSGAIQHRRSLYFTHSRDDQHRFLNLFDDASILACYRRPESIIPQQALALSNSLLSTEAAEAIAETLEKDLGEEATNSSAFINAAFIRLLGWRPSEEELEICLSALNQWQAEPADSRNNPSPKASLVHALLNHNDFITIR